MLNFQQFLMSSSGGAWKIGEIKRGTHINSSVATTIQRLCKDADIAVIFYSGHGFMNRGKNYININPKEHLAVTVEAPEALTASGRNSKLTKAGNI